jgi:nucleotide-binding universal stress UspA family protein
MTYYLFELQIHARSIILRGKGTRPGEALVNAAAEEGPCMIIMGSRGLGKIRRTVLGSVSEFVLHHAPQNCAVTILRDQ